MQLLRETKLLISLATIAKFKPLSVNVYDKVDLA